MLFLSLGMTVKILFRRLGMIKSVIVSVILGSSVLLAQNMTVKPLQQKSQTYMNEPLQQKSINRKDEPKKKKSYSRGTISTH